MTITLRNSFHSRTTSLRVPPGVAPEEALRALLDDCGRFNAGLTPRHWANPRRVWRRVCDALCGSSECTCGGVRD